MSMEEMSMEEMSMEEEWVGEEAEACASTEWECLYLLVCY
jgi:hypothetical protein